MGIGVIQKLIKFKSSSSNTISLFKLKKKNYYFKHKFYKNTKFDIYFYKKDFILKFYINSFFI